MSTRVVFFLVPLLLLAGFGLGRMTSNAEGEGASVDVRAQDAEGIPVRSVDVAPNLTGHESASDSSAEVVSRLTRIEEAIQALAENHARLARASGDAGSETESTPDYAEMEEGAVKYEAERLLQAGKDAQSLKAFLALRERMTDDHPEWIDTTMLIARLHGQVGNPAKADAEYVAVEEKLNDPGNVTSLGARWSRGLLKAQQGDYTSARKLMLELASAPISGRPHPNHLRAWGRLRAATYATKLGKKDVAREELLKLRQDLAPLKEDRILINIRKGIEYGLVDIGE